MVKGISRQVIVVRPPDQALFDQAIFILSEKAVGREEVTEEKLLRQAGHLLRDSGGPRRRLSARGPIWACGGAAVTGLVWLLTALL